MLPFVTEFKNNNSTTKETLGTQLFKFIVKYKLIKVVKYLYDMEQTWGTRHKTSKQKQRQKLTVLHLTVWFKS